MPSSTEHDAVALAGRIRSGLAKSELSPDGPLRVFDRARRRARNTH